MRIHYITIWYDNVDGVGLNEILWCSVLSSLLEIALQGQFRLTFTNEPIYTALVVSEGKQAFYYASKKPNYSGFQLLLGQV